MQLLKCHICPAALAPTQLFKFLSRTHGANLAQPVPGSFLGHESYAGGALWSGRYQPLILTVVFACLCMLYKCSFFLSGIKSLMSVGWMAVKELCLVKVSFNTKVDSFFRIWTSNRPLCVGWGIPGVF